MGPGAYSPERADSLTKSKTATINMGSSAARGSFIKKDDANVGPGQYDDRNYEIGSKSKGFIIGEKRQERVIETMGPGAYDADRADAYTKVKTSTTINMSSSPARPASFANQNGSGQSPGQYDDRSYEFGSKTKSFTIGEKRQTRVVESMGPGAYSPERADAVTKTKTTTSMTMGSSPPRGSFVRQGDNANIGPG